MNNVRPIYCSRENRLPLVYKPGGPGQPPRLAVGSSLGPGMVYYARHLANLPAFKSSGRELSGLNWDLTITQAIIYQEEVYRNIHLKQQFTFIRPLVTASTWRVGGPPINVRFMADAIFSDADSREPSRKLENFCLEQVTETRFKLSAIYDHSPEVAPQLMFRLSASDMLNKFIGRQSEKRKFLPVAPGGRQLDFQFLPSEFLIPGQMELRTYYEEKNPVNWFSLTFDCLQPLPEHSFISLSFFDEEKNSEPLARFSILPHPISALAQAMMHELDLDQAGSSRRGWNL